MKKEKMERKDIHSEDISPLAAQHLFSNGRKGIHDCYSKEKMNILKKSLKNFPQPNHLRSSQV